MRPLSATFLCIENGGGKNTSVDQLLIFVAGDWTVNKFDTFLLGIAFALFMATIAAIVVDRVELWLILTMLGSETAYLVLSILAYYIYSLSKGVRLVVAIVLAGILAILVKHVLNLPRPPSSLWRVAVSGPGFPSGHACVATAFWVEAFLATQSLPFALLAVAVILGVSLSRIGLHVHYPRDVVGGVVLGFGVALLVYLASKRLGEKRMCYLTSCLATLAAALACYVGATEFELWALLGLALALPTYSEKIDDICSKAEFRRRISATIYALIIALAVSRIIKLATVNPAPAYLLLGILILRILPGKLCSAG